MRKVRAVPSVGSPAEPAPRALTKVPSQGPGEVSACPVWWTPLAGARVDRAFRYAVEYRNVKRGYCCCC